MPTIATTPKRTSRPRRRSATGRHGVDHVLQQDRALDAHAGAPPRLADDAADYGHLLRPLEVPPPAAADFFQIVNEISGQDLTWFFDQVYRSSNAFDYGVQDLLSDRRDDGTYRTVVVARRYGEATFPVDVVTTFADGHQITERWDGSDRRVDLRLRARVARGQRRRSIRAACCCSTPPIPTTAGRSRRAAAAPA